jgi:tRNA nucleotidyltransferase (CCA-adding enzyme)
VRARFPRGWTFGGRDVTGLTADFVLARKEGAYYDGRHPEMVEPGTLEDDLRRRDFTVNAMAKDVDGNLVDLFGGQEDLAERRLRTVGEPEDRFGEDALRAVRGLRFAVTKGMFLDEAVSDALRSEWLPRLLAKVSSERRREELLRAFKYDNQATFDLLARQTPEFREALFSGGVWLMPSLKK